MRDHSQNSIQMIENAQKFLRSSHDSDTGSENEFNDKKRQKYLDKVEDDHENRIQKDEEEETHVGGGEGGKEDKGEEMVIVAEEEKGEEEEEEQEEEEEDENEDEEEQEEVEIDDEEDELASSASSPSSPTRIMLPSPKLAVVKDKQISSPIIPNTTDSPQQQSPSCSNCKNNELKMTLMKHEMDRLKAQISQLERQCYKQNNQINKLLRLRDRTERWRKQIISDLARGPLIVSDDDDDEDEDEEDEDEDD
ncbi:uncharacterized protein BX663DRAFT_502838, partial [Cokeromyces recurvatus]|uniref:uncharacterized protein n=1 Tax=Cokeromyces recurvatus TaxID=90255 RepID=UPI00221F7224